jgi:hypothetical protein
MLQPAVGNFKPFLPGSEVRKESFAWREGRSHGLEATRDLSQFGLYACQFTFSISRLSQGFLLSQQVMTAIVEPAGRCGKRVAWFSLSLRTPHPFSIPLQLSRFKLQAFGFFGLPLVGRLLRLLGELLGFPTHGFGPVAGWLRLVRLAGGRSGERKEAWQEEKDN